MVAAFVAAMAMGMAAEPKIIPMDDGTYQATKLICRHKPGARPSGPPFCRSSGHLTPLQCGCSPPDLECEVKGDRVLIRGQALTVMETTLRL